MRNENISIWLSALSILDISSKDVNLYAEIYSYSRALLKTRKFNQIWIFILYDEREREEVVGYLFMSRCVSSRLPHLASSSGRRKNTRFVFISSSCCCWVFISPRWDFWALRPKYSTDGVLWGRRRCRTLKCSFCTLCLALLCQLRQELFALWCASVG